MRFELLEPGGDFGGGVGVLLRDGDSLGAETSEDKGHGLMVLLRRKKHDKFESRFYPIQFVKLRKY